MKLLRNMALIAFVHASAAYAMEPSSGQAACNIKADGRCYIAWDLTQDKERSSYRIERFEPSTGTWEIEQEGLGASGVADRYAATAHLYRVVGCSAGADADCVGTSAYWSPVLPRTAEEIPATVLDGSGRVMSVAKTAPLRTQILQYNVYLFVRAFDKVDFNALPSMTGPPASPETLADLVHVNVYPNYTGYQGVALGVMPDPGPERSGARVIHPDGHPEHVHPAEDIQN